VRIVTILCEVARLLGPAGMPAWEIRYVSAGKPGVRQVWAPDQQAAAHVLIQNASWWGLNEHPRILSVIRLQVREQTIREDDQRAA
jgi:hypothetical protein